RSWIIDELDTGGFKRLPHAPAGVRPRARIAAKFDDCARIIQPVFRLLLIDPGNVPMPDKIPVSLSHRCQDSLKEEAFGDRPHLTTEGSQFPAPPRSARSSPIRGKKRVSAHYLWRH